MRNHNSIMSGLIRVQQRGISSDAQENFPYVFKNTREIVKTKKETKQDSLDAMNELIVHPDFRLVDGFSMAYF